MDVKFQRLTKLLFLATSLFYTVKSDAQRCGGGIFSLNVFTLNGEKTVTIEYEVLPVSQEFIVDSIIDINENFYIRQNKTRNIYGGIVFRNDLAEKALSKSVSSKDELNFKRFVASQSIPMKGTLEQNIDFQTFETVFFPVFLKLKTKTETTYILVNLFGGCDRHTSILYQKNTPPLLR